VLHEEYARLARSLENVTEEQAKQIITPVLDKLRAVTGAIIADVWVREAGKDDVDILVPFLRRKDREVPETQFVVLTETAKGLLVWVAEKLQPVWLDIEAHATHAINKLTGLPIEGRYVQSIYDRTRAFIAVPISYRGHFAILTIESNRPDSLNEFHIELMKTLREPTGILIWKSGVSETIGRQTNEAIYEFQAVSSDFAPPTLTRFRTGFIARPFDSNFEYISKALEKAFITEKIRVATYESTAGSKLVASDMLDQISAAHFGIADITSLNRNVLVELGAMIALNKPLIILRSEGDDATLPFDIAGYNYYRYAIVDARIQIVDAASHHRSLEQVVSAFISTLLSTDAIFMKAEASN
jgi:hypothetical protein